MTRKHMIIGWTLLVFSGLILLWRMLPVISIAAQADSGALFIAGGNIIDPWFIVAGLLFAAGVAELVNHVIRNRHLNH